MSISVPTRMVPTNEELKLLRDKFNKIQDLHYDISHNNGINETIPLRKNSNKGMGKNITNKLVKTNGELNQRINELTILLNTNQQKVNQYDKSLKDYEEHTKRKNNNKSQISDDYLGINNENINHSNYESKIDNKRDNDNCIIKDMTIVKAENVLLKEQINKLNKQLFNYEKENKLIQYTNSISNEKDYDESNYFKLSVLNLLNKNRINDKCLQVLLQLFKNDKQDLVKYLFNRIDALEFQNYALLNKIENYQNIITQLSDDMCEYINIICDIRNVLNVMPEDVIQINENFLTIRDTLNEKESTLSQQQQSILARKTQIEEDTIRDINTNMLICKDKIAEGKVLLASQGANFHLEKYLEVMNDRINVLESLRDSLGKYEEFVQFMNENEIDSELEQRMKYKQSLIKDNSLLKANNIKMKHIIVELISNNEITLNENLLLRINRVLNETHSNLSQNEDLIELLKCQAMMLEQCLT